MTVHSHNVVRIFTGVNGHHCKWLPFSVAPDDSSEVHQVMVLGSLQSEVVPVGGGRHVREVQETMMLADVVTARRDGAPAKAHVTPLANFLLERGTMTALCTHSKSDGRTFLVAGDKEGHLHSVVVDLPSSISARVEDIQVRGGVRENDDGSISSSGVLTHGAEIAAVDVCPKTGQLLSAAADGSLRVAPLEGGGLGASGGVELAGPSGFRGFADARWTMPNTLVAAGSGGGLQLWDCRQPGQPVSCSPAAWGFQGHGCGSAGARILSVAAHPSRPHVCASATSSGLLTLWDLRFVQRPVTAAAPAPGGPVWQVQFDAALGPDGAPRVVACTESGLLLSAALEGGPDAAAVEVLARDSGALVSMDISPLHNNAIVALTDQESILHVDRAQNGALR